MSEYDFVHHWFDSHFPEPAWKRKRQPIHISLELKCFVVLVHLCNLSSSFYNAYHKLVEAENSMIPIPSEFELLWRQVITFREHLRKKKQEYATHTTIGFNHALSQIIPLRNISSTQILRSDSSQFRSEQTHFIELNAQSQPSHRRSELRRLMSSTEVNNNINPKGESKPIMNSS